MTVGFDDSGHAKNHRAEKPLRPSAVEGLDTLIAGTAGPTNFQAAPSTQLSQGGMALADITLEKIEFLFFFRSITKRHLALNFFVVGIWDFLTFDVAYEVTIVHPTQLQSMKT